MIRTSLLTYKYPLFQDISILVEDYVDSEFNMVCEDGSPDEIGEIVVTMYRQCAEGDFSLVNTVNMNEYTNIITYMT